MFFSFTCYCFGDIFAYNSLTNMLDCRKEGELFQIYCQLAFLVLLALMIAVFIILDVFNANKSIKKYIKNKTFSNIKQTNYKSIIP